MGANDCSRVLGKSGRRRAGLDETAEGFPPRYRGISRSPLGSLHRRLRAPNAPGPVRKVASALACSTDSQGHHPRPATAARGSAQRTIQIDDGRRPCTSSPKGQCPHATPTLRNVALTWPYLHDGSAKTLDEVLAFYVRGGTPNPTLDPLMRPVPLTTGEIADLKAFLEALTGELPEIAAPTVPQGAP